MLVLSKFALIDITGRIGRLSLEKVCPGQLPYTTRIAVAILWP